jgi:hypothetical protein
MNMIMKLKDMLAEMDGISGIGEELVSLSPLEAHFIMICVNEHIQNENYLYANWIDLFPHENPEQYVDESGPVSDLIAKLEAVSKKFDAGGRTLDGVSRED